MSVSTIQQANKDLEAQKTRQVEKRQAELKKIDDKYEIQQQAIKDHADKRITELRDENHKELLSELENKEQKLGTMKNSLKETENIILQQKEKLTKDLQNSRDEKSLNHEMRMKDMSARHDSQTRDVNEKFAKEQQSLNVETQRELARQQLKNFKASNKVRMEYDKKLSDDSKNFTNQKFSQELQNSSVLSQQKNEFQNEFRIRESTHNEKYAQQQIRHNHERETSRQQNDQLKVMDQKDHEHRYQVQLATQADQLKNLDAQAKHEIEKIKLDISKNKQYVETRAQDPFYNGTILKPKITDKQDHYLIQMELPSHEAPLVNLAAKDRNLKLNFNRLTDHQIKLEDGSINKTKKSESVVKEFTVADIVNPKKVERTYQDGVLTYKIEKA
jgi:HSP20 family molecular chaperone IbpA